MKTERPTSCAVPPATAASAHPATASSSGRFGNCAMGKRRGHPSWPRRQSSSTVTALMLAGRPASRLHRTLETVCLKRTRRPTQGARGPGLTEAISAAIVEHYAEFYAHDRTTTTTYINDNVVVCVLENILTKGEGALVADGARGEVIDGRVAFQTDATTRRWVNR
jgi:hypothetical protein